MALAIASLDPADRAQLDTLWTQARTGAESRLCAQPVDPGSNAKPDCIDYAAWPAISGDHSCSAADMLHNVLETDWILKVARVAARLNRELEAAKRRDQRVNALRDSDIELQRADPDYATRAGSNNVHFLLARPDVSITPRAYAELALGPGAELNAAGAYAWYHVRALAKAAQLARGEVAPDAQGAVVRAALADEAFALHFLEDSFAAGHVAGTWGNAALRKGTHDYYNEHGMETVTWSGERITLLGDAYMRPQDEERAAQAVQASLMQLLGAFAGGPAPGEQLAVAAGPEQFDVCKETRFPASPVEPGTTAAVLAVLKRTPVPALGEGIGELPRFRAELGPFIGIAAAARGASLEGGFGADQTTVTTNGALELGVRAGLGLEGVMNESGDGLVFVELGVRQDSPTASDACPDCSAVSGLAAAVPARSALTARLRVPFWLIPGDLLIAAPVLAFTSPRTLQAMAVQAGNGGLIPWQSGLSTPIGRFQFVLGREVGLSFYGYGGRDQVALLPSSGPGAGGVNVVSLRSIQLDLPILEYRPFRSFSLEQSSSVIIQLYAALDMPTHSQTVSPAGGPTPDLRNIPIVGLRLVFDWRHYF